ncbi:MAG: efflux RND transporter periplasmic adaptor subunit [Phycisphaerales bacterium]|nr:efflux RND transporter periplasmic adaptor subunit [Phycisphaerae bacterium]NNF42728.1 efflux RND transporter periplasmic adaptor subunit [Phycisphaerales bacterium]NNM25792.1 efflux RND transporter periplasmic adaptor subunit [Phycisphaerales bacterium]
MGPNRNSLMLLVVLTTVAAGVAVTPTAAQGPPATAVLVAPVTEETLAERRQVTGELRAVARSLVATIEPGLVRAVLVEAGDVVRAGDPLARLDRRRLELTLQQLQLQALVAKAVAAARQAELDMETRDVEALRTLEARSAINPKELLDAEAEMRIAAARRDEATHELGTNESMQALLRTRLSDMEITAPFDGVIVAKHTESGQWVAEGDGLVEIVATGAYDAWLDVPQRYAPTLRGSDARIRVLVDATGVTTEPLAARVVPRVDAAARTFPVRVRLDDPAGTLAEGMSVTGWVPTGRDGAFLTVPRDALLRNDIGFYVYLARPDGAGGHQATPVSIRLLFEAGARVAIEARGLSAGDQIVVEGNERLFPMMPISFQESPGRPGPDA